tara:strand:+ start:2385 stop:3032 length:648 start_codon:yes stop_codon:yes gene_type:complete
MSTLNVDNINEYTTDGKVNVGHDIKLASGKSVLDSDGKKTGALVLLTSATASSSADITLDNFVDTSTYSMYFIVIDKLIPATDNVQLRVNFRSGGSSGSDITGTYYRAGNYQYASTSGSGNNTNSSSTDYSILTGGVGTATGEGITLSGVYSVADGSNGTSYLRMDWVFKSRTDALVKDVETASIKAVTAVTGIKFYMSSGNIASGTFDVYGYKR